MQLYVSCVCGCVCVCVCLFVNSFLVYGITKLHYVRICMWPDSQMYPQSGQESSSNTDISYRRSAAFDFQQTGFNLQTYRTITHKIGATLCWLLQCYMFEAWRSGPRLNLTPQKNCSLCFPFKGWLYLHCKKKVVVLCCNLLHSINSKI